MDFNKVVIVWNITNDLKLFTLENGKKTVSFAVATNRKWKDANGEIQEETEFHNVVAWASQAENITAYAKKGTKILVEGRLKTRNWTTEEGIKRNKTEIIIENFILLSNNDKKTSKEVEETVAENINPQTATLDEITF